MKHKPNNITSKACSNQEPRNDRNPKTVDILNNKDLKFIRNIKSEEKFKLSLTEPSLPKPSPSEPSLIRKL